MIYAQLGDIQFEVFGPITGLDTRRGWSYAEHQVIEGAPRLQYTGVDLETCTLQLVFDRSFCDPPSAYRELVALGDRRQAVPLVMASGEVRGTYVVREVDQTVENTDELGNVSRSVCRVSLTQWVPVPGEAPPAPAPVAVEGAPGAQATPVRADVPPAGDWREIPPVQITRGGG